MSKCAACGKGGDNLKVCTSCEQVSYCNAKCRKAHRSKHKKECRQLAAEKRNQNAAIRAEVDAISEKFRSIEISDEELFANPPPKEDCPICMQPIPYALGLCQVYTMYQPCCGKTFCEGCNLAAEEEVKKGNMKPWCTFCRKPNPNSQEELMRRLQHRMKLNDSSAFNWLGAVYEDGSMTIPKDIKKAVELLMKAAELGHIRAHNSLAHKYYRGHGVEEDDDKAIRHWKLAAMGGHEYARCMLGDLEKHRGNMDRATKHHMIAARSGYVDALEQVGEAYKSGHVTKEEYMSTLRAYQDSQDEMRSEQRTKRAEERQEEGWYRGK